MIQTLTRAALLLIPSQADDAGAAHAYLNDTRAFCAEASVLADLAIILPNRLCSPQQAERHGQ